MKFASVTPAALVVCFRGLETTGLGAPARVNAGQRGSTLREHAAACSAATRLAALEQHAAGQMAGGSSGSRAASRVAAGSSDSNGCSGEAAVGGAPGGMEAMMRSSNSLKARSVGSVTLVECLRRTKQRTAR